MTILASFMSFTIVASAAVAVDIGQISADKRKLNSVTDLVALDVARMLEGAPLASDIRPDAEQVAYNSAKENGYDIDDGQNHEIVLRFGTYSPLTGFVECPYNIEHHCFVNAVEADISDHSERLFAFWTDGANLDRQTPAANPYAGGYTPPTCAPNCDPPIDPPPICQSGCTTPPPPPNCPTACTYQPPVETLFAGGGMGLGSFAARMDSSQFAIYNAVMTELLNPAGDLGVPAVVLTAAGYDGLANVSVTADDLATALGFASPNEMFEGSVSVKDMLTAYALFLTANGDPTELQAVTPLTTLAQSTSPSLSHNFEDLFEIAAGDGHAAGSMSINLIDLIVASASVANQNNLLSFSIPTPPGLVNLGVTIANVSMGVLEAPKFVFGPAELDQSGNYVTTVRNSQVQMYFDLDVILDPTAAAQLGTLQLRMPVYVDAFTADAELRRVLCDPDREAAADPLAADEIDIFGSVSDLTVAVGQLNQNITNDVDPVVDIAMANLGTITRPLTGGTFPVGAVNKITLSGAADLLTFFPTFDDENTQTVYGPDPTATDPVAVGTEVKQGLTFINMTTGNPVAATTQGILEAELYPVLDELDSFAELVANGMGLTIGGADVTANGIDCLAADPIIVN